MYAHAYTTWAYRNDGLDIDTNALQTQISFLSNRNAGNVRRCRHSIVVASIPLQLCAHKYALVPSVLNIVGQNGAGIARGPRTRATHIGRSGIWAAPNIHRVQMNALHCKVIKIAQQCFRWFLFRSLLCYDYSNSSPITMNCRFAHNAQTHSHAHQIHSVMWVAIKPRLIFGAIKMDFMRARS